MVINRTQAAEIAAQIGSGLMPDNDQWTNRFTVQSSTSSAVYVIAQRRSDGVWGCSCRGWTHYRHCKHTTNILQRLASLADRVETSANRWRCNTDTLQMLRSARVAYLDLSDKTTATERFRAKPRKLDL